MGNVSRWTGKCKEVLKGNHGNRKNNQNSELSIRGFESRADIIIGETANQNVKKKYSDR